MLERVKTAGKTPTLNEGYEHSELNRRTRLLNGLIWLLMGTLGIFLVYVLTTGMESWVTGLFSFAAALVVSGIGYWLARSGRFYAAVYLFLSGFVVLLLFIVFMGGRTAFTISGETGMGWGVVATAIMISFVLACMAWLFGESINNAFSTIKKRSEELLATEEELQHNQEKLQRMWESVTEGIAVVDLKGVITEVNQRMVEIHGSSAKEKLLGKKAFILVADRDHKKITSNMRRALKEGIIRGEEYTLVRNDGTEFPAELSTNALKDGHGDIIGHITVVRDITRRKKSEHQLQEKNEELDAQNEELKATEEELRASNEELQAAHNKLLETQEQLIRSEKLAAIGQLASGVGHELRNPLGAIKNAGFYIRRRVTNTDLPKTEPRVMEFLGIIEEEVNSANKVITDLLGFSRVAKPTVTPANIAGIIEDALRYTPIPENIELIKDINNALPMVMVDGDQIKQVFLNIALNALQAMGEESGRLEIRAADKGKFVEVELIDTGGGIPDDIKNKIFDPLFTTKAKGVGLGLSVCKTIIERHQGDIEVKSQPGKGTTFTISLPTQKILEPSAITKGGDDGKNQRTSS